MMLILNGWHKARDMESDMNPAASVAGRRVFVTGANGFIGRHLVHALTQAGARVTVLLRTGHTKFGPSGSAVATVVGSLGDPALLEASLKDHEIVFSLAYDGHASATANLGGLEALLRAAATAGVERIVHTSSIVVYDNWPNNDITEANTMNRAGGSGYRRAKIEMERRLMAGSIPAAILQPTIVYGPGSVLWTDQFAESLVGGGIVLPTPEGHCNGVFVVDVVQALLLAANLPDLGQERFIISGDRPFRWSDLLNGYARIIGMGTVQTVPVNELISRLGPDHEGAREADVQSFLANIYVMGRTILGRERFEKFVRQVKRRLSHKGMLYPDHHLLGVFSATGKCSIEHARNRLGFEPEYDLAKGLAATESYLRKLVVES
jgi:nucleoside-diphosphate-sugar epimerase